MKKIHHKSLKFHTLYTAAISIIFLIVILFAREITLFTTSIFLILYIIGNGIIHTIKNELKRDTVIEYIIVSTIILVIAIGTIN